MKPIRFMAALLALCVLSGCTIPSGDELLAAPRPSKNYQTLQAELEKILASGYSYAAPSAGENRSTVQLVDLDGDGTDEAISFFRGAAAAARGEFTVFVHKRQDEQYVLTGQIEGKGTDIQSVEYPAITPDGRRGVAITWLLTGGGVSALTMCDFDAACAPRVLLETEYSAMELFDLSGNGARDLLLLTSDPAGKRIARLYQYLNGELSLVGEAPASPEAVSVERVTSGYVAGLTPAVFAEQKTAGGVGLTTDIFVAADGTLKNLALDGEDSMTRGTYRPVSVYAADVNGDQITELPRAVLMAGYTDAASPDSLFMLDWYSYSVSEEPVPTVTTYQSLSDGWSMQLDPDWHDRITAVKTTESGLSAVQFFEYLGEDNRIPLFTIYCATGSLRDYYILRDDLIQLGETGKGVFFARLERDAAESSFEIRAEDISARFSLLTSFWST